MKNLFIVSLAVMLFSACGSGDSQQTVIVGNKYSVSIPSFLSETKELNEDASLQYQNPLKEFYVAIIDEPKDELGKALEDNGLTELYSNDIKGYSDLLVDAMVDGITVSKKSEPLDTVVNGMPARLVSIKGTTEGIDIYYALAYIEGKERFYQVMTWTLASKEAEHKEPMNRLLYTLKEL